MKKTLYILFFMLIAGFVISGCYTSTIDALSTFKFQLALIFKSNHYNKFAPDTSLDVSNLNRYKDYLDNKEKITKAEIISFNYWIDSLVMDNNKPFDPMVDDVEFEYIRFTLIFVNPLPGRDPLSENPNDFTVDPAYPPYVLGEFRDVNIRDYYRLPDHIMVLPDSIAKVVAKAVKDKPTFYIITEYSKTKGQQVPKRPFPYVKARYDMMIRFEYNL